MSVFQKKISKALQLSLIVYLFCFVGDFKNFPSETQDFANKTAEASRIPADQLTCAGDLV